MIQKINRCPSCNGSKSIIGLGSMLQKCKACNGVGYLNPINDIDIDEDDVHVEEVKIKKKPGRKPKH